MVEERLTVILAALHSGLYVGPFSVGAEECSERRCSAKPTYAKALSLQAGGFCLSERQSVHWSSEWVLSVLNALIYKELDIRRPADDV
jgi:hypothetical protein